MAASPKVFPKTLSWSFILLGLLAVSCGLWALVQSLRSEHWPTTEGLILTARLQQDSSRRGTHYSADSSYEYWVEGARFVGARILFGPRSTAVGDAQQVLNQYPIGEKVVVHYLPSDPQVAVLETKIHGGAWFFLGLGTFFALAGIVLPKIIPLPNKASRGK
jgi:hypothetical protein